MNVETLRLHQCRCWIGDDGRCPNRVPVDQPFCETCDDRHPEVSEVWRVGVHGELVPG